MLVGDVTGHTECLWSMCTGLCGLPLTIGSHPITGGRETRTDANRHKRDYGLAGGGRRGTQRVLYGALHVALDVTLQRGQART